MESLEGLPLPDLQASLLLASQQGRTDIIGKLLQVEPSLCSYKDPSRGGTALHVAVLAGQLDSTRALLRAGVPPESRDNEGLTALQHCKEDDAMRGAFFAEMLQCVAIEDVSKVKSLVAAGVSPLSFVQTGTSQQRILDWAEELCGGEKNSAVDFLRFEVSKEKEKCRCDDGDSDVNNHSDGDAAENSDEKNNNRICESDINSSDKSPQKHRIATRNLQLQLEEKDALIGRLRSMLGDMAEEQEMMRRLVHKHGSTTTADHLRRLQAQATECKVELALKTSECESQACQLRVIRSRLDEETTARRAASRRIAFLEDQISQMLTVSPLKLSETCESPVGCNERDIQALMPSREIQYISGDGVHFVEEQEKGKWDKDHADNANLTVEIYKNKNKNTALERGMEKCTVATLTMVKSPEQDPPLKELQQMRGYPGKVFTPVASSSTNPSWLSWLWGSSNNNRPEMNGKVMCL